MLATLKDFHERLSTPASAEHSPALLARVGSAPHMAWTFIWLILPSLRAAS